MKIRSKAWMYFYLFSVCLMLPGLLTIHAQEDFQRTSTTSPDLVANRTFFDYISGPKVTDKEISGKLTVINNMQDIHPKLYLATELYMLEEIHDSQNSDQKMMTNRLINRTYTSFSMEKMSQFDHSYNHPIPFELFKGEYVMLYKLYNFVGKEIDTGARSLGILGSADSSLYYDEAQSFLSYAEKNEIPPLEGPNINPGEFPVFHMKFVNKSTKQIDGKLKAKIFIRDELMNPKPIKEIMLEEVSFEAGESKIIKVDLPSIEQPESYKASIEVENDQGRVISNLAEARYVMNGVNANILELKVERLDDENMKGHATVIGPAGDASLENAQVTFQVVHTETKEMIYSTVSSIKLDMQKRKVEFIFSPSNYSGEIQSKASVMYEGKIIASKSLAYQLESLKRVAPPILKKPPELNDIASSPFKKEILYLASKGIMVGYPGNLFEPKSPFSRAEAATVLCRILEIGLPQESIPEEISNEEIGFSDVNVNSWAKEFIKKARRLNLIKGYPDGTFYPDRPISYNELFAMGIKLFNQKENQLQEIVWPDGILGLAFELKIADELSFTDSSKMISREEVAKVLYNILKLQNRIEKD